MHKYNIKPIHRISSDNPNMSNNITNEYYYWCFSIMIQLTLKLHHSCVEFQVLRVSEFGIDTESHVTRDFLYHVRLTSLI